MVNSLQYYSDPSYQGKVPPVLQWTILFKAKLKQKFFLLELLQ